MWTHTAAAQWVGRRLASCANTAAITPHLTHHRSKSMSMSLAPCRAPAPLPPPPPPPLDSLPLAYPVGQRSGEGPGEQAALPSAVACCASGLRSLCGLAD